MTDRYKKGTVLRLKDSPHNPCQEQPEVYWYQDFDTLAYCCAIQVPRSWCMESAAWRRKLLLWWWLTRLVWKMPA